MGSDNVSGSALARILGVTEAAVRAAWRAGRIPRHADRTYPLQQCVEAWAKNTDPARRKARPRRDGDTLADLALRTVAKMQAQSAFDAGMAAALVAAQHRIGPAAVAIAKELHIKIQDETRLRDAITLAAMATGEGILRMAPSWADVPADRDIEGFEIDLGRVAN